MTIADITDRIETLGGIGCILNFEVKKMHQTLSVASNAKMIEVLKSELIGEAADVLRAGLSPGGREELLDALAGTVLLSYMLAKRCGISFSEIDMDISNKIGDGIRAGHTLETDYGDLSSLKKHFESGNMRGLGQDKRKKF